MAGRLGAGLDDGDWGIELVWNWRWLNFVVQWSRRAELIAGCKEKEGGCREKKGKGVERNRKMETWV